MDGSLYLRIRGRVQGPFDEEKLRSLVRRGQLSRMHQLSTDGTNWQRADEFPELFVVPRSSASNEAVALAGSNTPANSIVQDTSNSNEVESPWHYAIGDKKFGPVDPATLRSLVGAGQLKPTSQVWRKGMHSWATIESIAGLLPDQAPSESLPVIDTSVRRQSTDSTARDSESTDYSRDIYRSLGDAQGWILFIVWSGFAISTLHFLFGFVAIAFGLSKHLTPLVTGGLMNLLSAAVIFTGALYLFNYSRHISRFVSHHKDHHLDAAMRTLKNFWMYIGIILIVLFVFGVGVAVWVAPVAWEAISSV